MKAKAYPVELMRELEEKRTALHYLKGTGQLDALEEQDLRMEIASLEKEIDEATKNF